MSKEKDDLEKNALKSIYEVPDNVYQGIAYNFARDLLKFISDN